LRLLCLLLFLVRISPSVHGSWRACELTFLSMRDRPSDGLCTPVGVPGVLCFEPDPSFGSTRQPPRVVVGTTNSSMPLGCTVRCGLRVCICCWSSVRGVETRCTCCCCGGGGGGGCCDCGCWATGGGGCTGCGDVGAGPGKTERGEGAGLAVKKAKDMETPDQQSCPEGTSGEAQPQQKEVAVMTKGPHPQTTRNQRRWARVTQQERYPFERLLYSQEGMCLALHWGAS